MYPGRDTDGLMVRKNFIAQPIYCHKPLMAEIAHTSVQKSGMRESIMKQGKYSRDKGVTCQNGLKKI